MKILIIEDETELANSMVAYLQEENYICEVSKNFQSAVAKTETWDYNCIILDISLPDGSGLDILKQLRKNNKSEGVIIISARNSIEDRIKGLKLGADDYLVKPFHLSELAARVAAIIRRKVYDVRNTISFHEIVMDTVANTVTVNGHPIDLTRKEFELLLYLIANKGKVIPKNALMNHLWSEASGYGENFDFIYTHIKNLRKKLQQYGSTDYIRTIYGLGYKLADQ